MGRADYLLNALPRAVDIAVDHSVALRECLPRDYLDYMGVMHSDRDDPRRAAFAAQVSELVQQVLQHLPLDGAADQQVAAYLHSRMPLHLPPGLRKRSYPQAGSKLSLKSEVGRAS